MNSKKLRLCLVHLDAYTPEMPARPAVTEIYGTYMPSLGHDVVWISSSKNNQNVTKEMYNQVTVYTIPYIYSQKISTKAFNFFRHYYLKYKVMSQILNDNHFDIIQVRNDVFSALISLCFKKKYDIPFVFQYSFPKKSFSLQKSVSWYSYCFDVLQNRVQFYILKKADLILPISKWMKIELIKQGIPKFKMVPLPMGVNPESFPLNIENSNFKQKYCIDESKLIVYTGNMNKIRSLDVVIRAFSKVIEHKKNLKLLMIGDGNDRSNLEDLCANLRINKHVIFTGNVPYFEVPYYISVADICLSPIKPLDIYKVSSPTKLFEYMVMGKPVIANEEIPEQKEVIEASGAGVLVKFQPQSFADGILELLNDPKSSQVMGENGYKWVIKNRSYECMARQVEAIYLELLESYRKV